MDIKAFLCYNKLAILRGNQMTTKKRAVRRSVKLPKVAAARGKGKVRLSAAKKAVRKFLTTKVSDGNKRSCANP
jgi:hypothetical protein